MYLIISEQAERHNFETNNTLAVKISKVHSGRITEEIFQTGGSG